MFRLLLTFLLTLFLLPLLAHHDNILIGQLNSTLRIVFVSAFIAFPITTLRLTICLLSASSFLCEEVRLCSEPLRRSTFVTARRITYLLLWEDVGQKLRLERLLGGYVMDWMSTRSLELQQPTRTKRGKFFLLFPLSLLLLLLCSRFLFLQES